MSKKAVINIKTDAEVKEQAQQVADELGVPLSTVLNGYLKQFIRDKKVTFSAAPRMSAQLEETIAEAEKDIAHNDLVGPFESAEEMNNYLNESEE